MQAAVNPVSQVHPSQQVSVSAPRGSSSGAMPAPGLQALLKKIDDLLKDKAKATTKAKGKKSMTTAKKTYKLYRKKQMSDMKAKHKAYKKAELAKIRKMPMKQRAQLRKQLKDRLKTHEAALKQKLPTKVDESTLRGLIKTKAV